MALTKSNGESFQADAPEGTYINPIGVPAADPFIIFHDGSYYCYGTTSMDGFKVFHSPDMVNWEDCGMCFARTDSSWGRNRFWAPEVIEKDGKFLMHYSSGGGEEDVLHLSVAISDSPLGPFRDVAAPMFDFGDGKAWIDGHVFIDDDGKPYFYFSKDVSRNPMSQIFVAPLSDDLTQLAGPMTLCIQPDGGWEGDKWNEGPYVLKHKGLYYLMYSGNFYQSPLYGVGYAVSDNPVGPWTKYDGNPILQRSEQVSGPGHNSVVRSPDGKEMFIAYHVHVSPEGGVERHLAIDRLVFEPDGPGRPDRLRVVNGPSHTPQPMPSGAI